MNKKTVAPKLRFPEFTAIWEDKLFDEVFDFQQTNTFSRSEMNNEKGSTRNVHYGDVLIKYGSVLNDTTLIPYLNDDIDLSKFKGSSYVQDGDVIIADTAEDLITGKAVEIQNVNCNILSGLHTMLCRSKIVSAPKYWGYFLNSSFYHGKLVPLIAGAKVCSINKSSIAKTQVLFPSVPEQAKIADCLFSIDVLITAEEKNFQL